jgi:hypothetical protein
MAYFVVSYDLIQGKDYERLIDELKLLKAQKSLLSFWFVEADATAQGLKDHLGQFIDSDDRLVVVQFVGRPAYTMALKGTNDWIKAHF